jgi:hypothetical protein
MKMVLCSSHQIVSLKKIFICGLSVFYSGLNESSLAHQKPGQKPLNESVKHFLMGSKIADTSLLITIAYLFTCCLIMSQSLWQGLEYD